MGLCGSALNERNNNANLCELLDMESLRSLKYFSHVECKMPVGSDVVQR